MAETYDTKLSPDEEKAFQEWAKAKGRERDTEDYDLRGAWKANAQEATNGHLPDTWKKPNHPTFSNESMYAEGRKAGRWVQDANGQWQFVAGEENLKHRSSEDLQKYFKEREPGASLVLPRSREEKFYGKKP